MAQQPRVRGPGSEPPLQIPQRSIINITNGNSASKSDMRDGVPARNQTESPSTLDAHHRVKQPKQAKQGSSSSSSSSSHSSAVISSPVAVKSRGYYDFRGQYIEPDELDFSGQQPGQGAAPPRHPDNSYLHQERQQVDQAQYEVDKLRHENEYLRSQARTSANQTSQEQALDAAKLAESEKQLRERESHLMQLQQAVAAQQAAQELKFEQIMLQHRKETEALLRKSQEQQEMNTRLSQEQNNKASEFVKQSEKQMLEALQKTELMEKEALLKKKLLDEEHEQSLMRMREKELDLQRQQEELHQQQQEQLQQQQNFQRQQIAAAAKYRQSNSDPSSVSTMSSFSTTYDLDDNEASSKKSRRDSSILEKIGTMTKLSNEAVLVTLPGCVAEGCFLWKIPFHSSGTPQRRFFQLRPPDNPEKYPKRSEVGEYEGIEICKVALHRPITLQWKDPKKKKKKPRDLFLDECESVLSIGHKTTAFWNQAAHRGTDALPLADLCFSLIAQERTVDLAAESRSEAKQWKSALTALLNKLAHLDRMEDMDQGYIPEVNIDLKGSSPPPSARRNSAQSTSRRSQIPPQPPATQRPSAPPLESFAPPPPPPQPSPAQAKLMLFDAVERMDSKGMKRILDGTSTPIDIMDDVTGDTPLLLACRLGHVDIVRLCLAEGAKNDPHPTFGQTALQAAVSGGHTGCVKLILNEASPSMADRVIVNHVDPNKQAPLHVSSMMGRLEILELLLMHGAEIRLVDSKGGTCLHSSVFGGSTEALAYLLDNGADILIDEPDEAGDVPLHYAATKDRLSCARLLLETCANPVVFNKQGQSPYSIAVSKGFHHMSKLIADFGGDKARNQTNTPSGPVVSNTVKPHYPSSTRGLNMPPHSSMPPAPPHTYRDSYNTSNLPYSQFPPQPPPPSSSGPYTTSRSPDPMSYEGMKARVEGNRSQSDPTSLSMFDGMELHTARIDGPSTLQASGSWDAIPPRPNSSQSQPTIIINHHYGSNEGQGERSSSIPLSARDRIREDAESRRRRSGVGSNSSGKNASHYRSSSRERSGSRGRERSGSRGRERSGSRSARRRNSKSVRRDSYSEDEEADDYYDQEYTESNEGYDYGYEYGDDYTEDFTDTYDENDDATSKVLFVESKKSNRQKSNTYDYGSSYDYPGATGDGEGEEAYEGYQEEEEEEETPAEASILGYEEEGGSGGLGSNDWWAPLKEEEREWYGVGEEGFYFIETDEVWDIGYSDGYPYYLQMSTGHSQWEDPRKPTGATTADSSSGGGGGGGRGGEGAGGGGGGKFGGGGGGEGGGSEDKEVPVESSAHAPAHHEFDFTPSNSYKAPEASEVISASNSNSTGKEAVTNKPLLAPKLNNFSEAEPKSSAALLSMDENKVQYTTVKEISPDTSSLSNPNEVKNGEQDVKSAADNASKQGHKKNSTSAAHKQSSGSANMRPPMVSPPPGKSLQPPSSPPPKHQPPSTPPPKKQVSKTKPEAEPRDKKSDQTLPKPSEATSNQAPAEVKEETMAVKKQDVGSAKEDKSSKSKLSDLFAQRGAMMQPPPAKVEKESAALSQSSDEAKDTVKESKISKDKKDKSTVKKDKVRSKKEESKSADIALPVVDSKETLKSDAALLKFVKMTEMGVPAAAVRMKMIGEQIPPEKILKFELTFQLITPEEVVAEEKRKRKQASSNDNQSDSEEEEEEEEEEEVAFVDPSLLKEHAILGKFVKMAKMGIPPNSVVHKMLSEGIAPELIKLFKVSHGMALTPKPKKQSKKSSQGNKHGKGVKMIPVHWEALSNENIESSVWADASKEDIGSDHMKALLSTFSAPTAPVKGASVVRASAPASLQSQCMIDPKRAYNMSISLAQFKSFSEPTGPPNGNFRYRSLCEAVLNMEERPEFEGHKVDSLIQLMPTEAEANKLKAFKGDPKELTAVEQFVYVISRFPHFEQRLRIFSLKHNWGGTVEDLKNRCKVIKTACEEIMSSKGLALVLRQMLVIGNIMNEGSKSGKQASGITLDSLLKLINTKGADKKTTVLDYVINLCFDKGQKDQMDFPSDFQHIETASRTPAKDIEKELGNLNKQIESLKSEQQRSTSELEAFQEETISSGDNSNLLSTALLKAYTSKINELVSQFPNDYMETENCVNETLEEVSKLAKYFGENPEKCSSEKVFLSILQFVSVFKLSKEKVIRTRHSKAKQKAAAAAATASGSKGGSGGAEDKSSPRTKGRNAMSAIQKRRSSIAGREVSSSSESDSDDGSDWDKSPAKTKRAEAK